MSAGIPLGGEATCCIIMMKINAFVSLAGGKEKIGRDYVESGRGQRGGPTQSKGARYTPVFVPEGLGSVCQSIVCMSLVIRGLDLLHQLGVWGQSCVHIRVPISWHICAWFLREDESDALE